MDRVAFLLPALVLLSAHAGAAPQPRFTQLVGWGGGDPATIVPAAADVGFTDIVVWRQDHDYLTQLVEQAQRHGIGVYVSLYLGDVKDWAKRYPDVPPPMQEIDATEQAAVARIEAALEAKTSDYQYGGEPVSDELEVFTNELLCFHDPRVVEFFQAQIRDILAVPGITGIAFDFFGYRNYRCCRCPRSMDLLDEYRQAHPDLPEAEALQRFSLDTLVAVQNDLATYARTLKPQVKVTGHVYPVYLPEPLYGNRLNWDTCGQTAAWFFEPFWTERKIRSYSRAIAHQAKRYWANAEGAALIGVYVRPGRYPVKGPERIERELRAILDGGTRRVQVCSLNDVLDDPATREVFRKFAPERAPEH
jgi:hypothetical protein